MNVDTQGKSGYTIRKLVEHTINMLTSFSSVPLKVASLVGFVFMLFGISILLYTLVIYFTAGGSVPGFSFLASIIAIFSGVQLFALGVIGEYIGRVHQQALNQPCYVISSETPLLHEREPRS